MEWNPDDWQGRSEKQVEDNNKIFGITIISFILVLLVLLLMSVFLTSCKSTETIDCDAYSMIENHQKNI